MGAQQLMKEHMSTSTQIRTAVAQDMPHIIQLAEREYNLFEQKTPFDPEITERYVASIMMDSNALGIVILNSKGQPFGYLAGTIDHLDLSTEPCAMTHHWFVYNPKHIYGDRNYGLQLLAAFEGWAKIRDCHKVVVGMRMDLGSRRAYDRVFRNMGFRENYVYYAKEID